MKVAVFDHGMGNLRSVSKALEAAGADVIVTDDADTIARRDALCVPGQGIFGRCVDNLTSDSGAELIRTWIGEERPFLGICLGLQVLFEHSEEGERKGLGLIPGRVRRLSGDVSIPHIGWNTVSTAPHTAGPEGRHTFYYFDHSYAAFPADPTVVTGWCEHGDRFAARVEWRSILGVQFHPEKSGADGISLLKEWLT